jgi:DNA repair exonuclease SbcCD ATPase subunit
VRSASRITPQLTVAVLVAGLVGIGWVARSTLAQDGPQAPTPSLRKATEGVGSVDRQTLILKQQFAAENREYLRRQLQEVQSQRRKLEARLKAKVRPERTTGEAPAPSVAEADVARAIEAHPRVTALTAQLAEDQEKLDSHKNYVRKLSRTGSDPSLPPLLQRVDATKAALEAARKALRPVVIAALNAEEQSLKAELDSQSVGNQSRPPIEVSPAPPPAGERSPVELAKDVRRPTAENDDPEKNARAFVEQNRKVAEAQLKNLRDEAEKLRSRLQKVEAGIRRWDALLAALQKSEAATRDPGATTELEPVPNARPKFNARVVPSEPVGESVPPPPDSGPGGRRAGTAPASDSPAPPLPPAPR